jgi:hypothetical protein
VTVDGWLDAVARTRESGRIGVVGGRSLGGARGRAVLGVPLVAVGGAAALTEDTGSMPAPARWRTA